MIMLSEPELMEQIQSDENGIRRTAIELGIDFLPVDIGNIKRDLELFMA